MSTATERRVAVAGVQARHQLSERRTVRMLGFARTTMRYALRLPERDAPLRVRLRELAADSRGGACRVCIGSCAGLVRR